MKSDKRGTMKGKEQPNQESIRTLREKKNCKYLRVLEANTIE